MGRCSHSAVVGRAHFQLSIMRVIELLQEIMSGKGLCKLTMGFVWAWTFSGEKGYYVSGFHDSVSLMKASSTSQYASKIAASLIHLQDTRHILRVQSDFRLRSIFV